MRTVTTCSTMGTCASARPEVKAMSPLIRTGSTRKLSWGVVLRLLGRFQLLAATSAPIVIQTRKSRLLLAYLASPPGQAHAREKLVGLLWPDAGEKQGRASLRHAL